MDSIKNGWNNLTGNISGMFKSKPASAIDTLQESTVTQTAGRKNRKRTIKRNNKKSKGKGKGTKSKKYNTRKRK